MLHIRDHLTKPPARLAGGTPRREGGRGEERGIGYLRLDDWGKRFARDLLPLPAGQTVVVDEVQRLPALLNEVHRFIESHGLRLVVFLGERPFRTEDGIEALPLRSFLYELVRKTL